MNDSTWTWISGSDSIDQPGVYGEKGNASSENVPGSRGGAVGWYDSLKQELWLFGGYGYHDHNSQGMSLLAKSHCYSFSYILRRLLE